MSDILTDDELHDLTGLKQGAAQIRWLRKNGIRAFIRADGKPRVLRAYLNREQHSRQNNNEPNFGALRGSQTQNRH